MSETRAAATGRRTIHFPDDQVLVVKDLQIPMSDGVALAADLYLPDGPDGRGPDRPLPVVIEYNPYRKDDLRTPADTRWAIRLAEHSYIGVRLDCRGSGASDGVTGDEYPEREQTDGAEAVEWFAAQPWCDGHVSMFGISYSAFAALQIAALAPPHLTTVIPIDFSDDRYTDDSHHYGGMPRMFFDVGFYGPLMVAFNALPGDFDSAGPDWAERWQRHLDENTPYVLEWLRHQVDGPYWRRGSIRGRWDRIRCPVFMIGGWHDGYPNPPFRTYERLEVPRKLLIGPWDHETPDRGIPGPQIDYLADVVRWLNHWCGRDGAGIVDEPPVVFYEQRFDQPDPMRDAAAGRWRAEREWPGARASEATLSLSASGRLERDPPARAGADAFDYIPWVGVDGELWSGGVPVGRSSDQRQDDALSLTYTTEPLTEPLHVAGRPRVALHVESSARVAAVACRLSEVAPGGVVRLVTKGVLNLTRRHSLTDPEPLVPGEVMEVAIELDATAWMFTPGNAIRLSVAGADFPNVWPTPEAAVTRIHYGPERPSRLTLPTLPADPSAATPELPPLPHVRYATRLSPPRATDRTQPVWEVVDDRLAGKVRVNAAWQRRAWGDQTWWTAEVDKHDPAIAGMHGRLLMRRFISTQEVRVTSDVAVHSTATDFHVTVSVAVTVNDNPRHSRAWVETIPRALL